MTYDLKPYPVYKDSGVPWLGEVPEHWEVRRIKTLFREKDERSGTGSGVLLSLTRAKGIVPQAEASNRIASAEDLSKYRVCRPGDLVMNRMQAWSGMFALSTYAGVISPDYSIFGTIDKSDVKFFEHLFKTPIVVDQFAQRSKGIGSGFNRLYTPDFCAVSAVVPPLSEQEAIVRFLDHADRRILRYIRIKQKLIALLEEQKQAIIHRAVTRGLDPNVRFKPSGVEWFGEVPEHWEVLRLKTLVRMIDQGVSPQAENRLADDGSWGVLKAGCVNRGVFRDTEHKRLPADFPFDPNLGVEIGDVLVSRASGSPQLVGSVGRVQSLAYRLILSDKTFRPVFNSRADSDFMVLAMNGRYYRQQVEQAISGAEGLANNLPSSSLRAFAFAVPPVSEQRTIVEHVRGLTNQLLGTISRALREIDLLREYRTRLIADVVTGKLDVRAAAAKLPEETDASEPLDYIEDAIEEETEDADLDAVPEEAEA